MKIVVCDDEQPCVDRLCALIRAYCTDRRLDCELVTFLDPEDLRKSEMEGYDLVFLDANMGEVSGIEAAKALRAVNRSAVLVYVSAFVEYAPMGYAVDAFRYLLKHDLDSMFAVTMDEIIGRLSLNAKRLIISTTNGEQSIVVAKLVFLESYRHQILLHLSDGTVWESRQHTLTELSSLLAPHSFLRIHKSFLVNPEHIVSMKNRVVTLTSGQTLSCGKADYSGILQAFMLWKGGI